MWTRDDTVERTRVLAIASHRAAEVIERVRSRFRRVARVLLTRFVVKHASFILVSSLVLGACGEVMQDGGPSQDPPDDARVVDFSELGVATRERIVRAVYSDADAAVWLADAVDQYPSDCIARTYDGATRTQTLRGSNCSTAAGYTFDGAVEIVDRASGTPSYRFDNVRITGETAEDTIAIDGLVDRTWQDADLIARSDLVVERSGIAIRTSIGRSGADASPLSGSFIELADGRRSIVTGTYDELAFASVDDFRFVRDGDCGTAPGDESICLRAAPSLFSQGLLRGMTCDADDQAVIVTDSAARMLGTVGGVSHDHEPEWDDARGAYVVALTTACSTLADYAMTQNESGSWVASRGELMTQPRVSWGR